MLFHEHLKKLRQELGYTQGYMAGLLNIDRSTYSRLEHKEKPPVYLVERICETFNVDAFAWLHCGVIEAVPQDHDTGPKVIHMSESDQSVHERQWRSRAVDLLAQITNLLEHLMRSSRGGGANSPPGQQ
jgi:transcriptional regulator with XRE-family HTH domain